MADDLERLRRLYANEGVITPCDGEALPLSVDQDGEIIYWICFESVELGRQSSVVDPTYYEWGKISGERFMKFLNERIEAGGEHVLIANPGTALQAGLQGKVIVDFLKYHRLALSL